MNVALTPGASRTIPRRPSKKTSHADRTARSRHHPRRGTHQRTAQPGVDPARLQPVPRSDHLRLAAALLRTRLVVLGQRDRGRHGRRHRAHRAAGPGVTADGHEPLHLLRRAVRRTGTAGRLGRRPASRARLHRADRVDRRRRDGERPRPPLRSGGERTVVRRRVRTAGRRHRRGRRLRLPRAARHVPRPRGRHDGPAGGRRDRVRPALHHRGAPGGRRPSASTSTRSCPAPRAPAPPARSPSSPCSASSSASPELSASLEQGGTEVPPPPGTPSPR